MYTFVGHIRFNYKEKKLQVKDLNESTIADPMF